MLQDRYGNRLSTGSGAARDAYDRGMDCVLSGNWGATEAFTEAITLDPRFSLGYAGLARACLIAGDMAGARAAITQAETLAEAADAREKAHVGALAAMLGGRPSEARERVKAHVLDYPRDAIAAQLCANVFGLIGFSGVVGREAELLAYTGSLLPQYGDDWWMLSMHALSLCETGQIAASQAMMERALAGNPRNANAAHFKAHALYEAGEAAAGRSYLEAWLLDYDPRASLHGHLTWHAALWALGDGDLEAMWRAADASVAPGGALGLPINVLTDTAALYHRAELAGVPVEAARWAALSDYAAQYFPQTGQSFADIHAALAHAMAGQGARLAQIAEGAKGFAGDLVQPVARAWGAVSRGDWATAVDDLAPVMATTERLGGSRAQRDLLELTYLNALIKLGQSGEAARVLASRRPVLADQMPGAV